MLPKLKLSSCLVDRILQLSHKCFGGLYGVIHDRSILLTSFSLNLTDTKRTDMFMEMQLRFPTGIDFYGLLLIDKDIMIDDVTDDIMNCLKEVIVTDNPVVLTKDLSTGAILPRIFCNGRLVSADYEIFTMDEFYESFIQLRLQTSLLLYCHANKKEIQRNIDILYNMVSSGSVVFHFDSTDIFVSGIELDDFNSPELGSLCNKVNTSLDPRCNQGAMDLSVFIQSSETNFEDRSSMAPFLSSHTDLTEQIIMEFSIDALCLAEKSRIVIESYGLFVDAVCRCIQNLKITLLRTPLEGPDLFEGLKHYHFLPDGLGHMLSVIYPAELSDDELFPLRERLHKELALSMNFPVFRRGNSLFFKRSKSFTPLLNVHVGLKPSGVKDGKQFLVKGHYWYYHYMQENVDDSGWGCAYRAFQTIFSWFRLQGYTSLRVPNHLDIQKCLVRLNDKESSFIGSRQWIGSTEISYCLDSMIGITSRILSVSSDHELDSVARELQCHFEVHGTPVMIGGGVLAHTILGVDFNESSGEVKFLVLDPHYTGEENIKLIQSKGWVSWKTKTFWAKHTFYNVCLPQRPTCI